MFAWHATTSGITLHLASGIHRPTVSLVVAAHNRLHVREIVEVLLKQGRRVQTVMPSNATHEDSLSIAAPQNELAITSRGARFTRRQQLDGGELSFEVATGAVGLP